MNQLTFRIDAFQIDSYVNRVLSQKLSTVKIIFGLFILGAVILSIYTKIYFLAIIALCVFGLVYLFVKNMFKGDLKTLAEITVFEIDKEQISKTIEEDGFSSLQKIRAERANTKYGSHLNQIIPFNEIDATEIRESEIVITSNSTNIINENGIITIPCEVEHFKEVKEYIQKNKDIFKVIST